ncbi:NAD(P)/FAD-dependent oxidoreductase [[Flexibacter] sp. ATCC 35208]|uniref:FAD-dependent oxidoreductase n=1 Tax=[Flexibacter] sp. ATCC 35208 TaxID=1936242 RepID=UPI0009CBE26D|nr:NAD(P)/FAD-dependent oxidoreductase [[Flexibacter] sp. ATCC 35208]OMP76726.1 2-polyprenyl-6-methoxyphenol hydroxylase [[Flexibacter] sp. ATCC 35208]
MKKIAIVGGGPGGLTLARLLQVKGVSSVKVYERDINKDARVQGATLDLHEESGLAALREAGLIPAFMENYRPGADKIRILDKDANIIVDEHAGEKEEYRPEIDRGPLRKILLESLADDTVVWDSQFADMERSGAGWLLQFKNGTTAYADIVVGADGANSKIRPFLTPIKPFFVGMTAVEGSVYDAAEKVPEMVELVKGGKLFIFGDSKTLIVSAKGDGTLSFYAGFQSAADWEIQGSVLDWFKAAFKGWAPIYESLIANVSGGVIPRPQYCMPLDQDWEAQANLTMLGDAAHLMPPYAGEGVNMAMLDALELSRCLTEGEDMLAAIAKYEREMRERASATAAMTLEQTEVLHGPDAMQHMLGLVS